MVCTASSAEVPEEAGMLPPEATSDLRVAEAVVKGALAALEALVEPVLLLLLPLLGTLLGLGLPEATSPAWPH